MMSDEQTQSYTIVTQELFVACKIDDFKIVALVRLQMIFQLCIEN